MIAYINVALYRATDGEHKKTTGTLAQAHTQGLHYHFLNTIGTLSTELTNCGALKFLRQKLNPSVV